MLINQFSNQKHIPPYAYKNLQRIRTIYNCSDKLVSGNRCPKKRMELGFTKMFFQASLQSQVTFIYPLLYFIPHHSSFVHDGT